MQGDGWLLSTTFGADAGARAEPFDAAELDLTLVWGPKRVADPED